MHVEDEDLEFVRAPPARLLTRPVLMHSCIMHTAASNEPRYGANPRMEDLVRRNQGVKHTRAGMRWPCCPGVLDFQDPAVECARAGRRRPCCTEAQSTRGECVGLSELAQPDGGPVVLVCFDSHECGS
jgi:hypothetical protein